MKEIIFSLVSRNILKVTTAIIFIYAFLHILSPFFIPIVLGGILAMALSPFVDYFMKKGMSRTKAINTLIAGIFLIGLIPSILFFIRGANVVYALFNQEGLMSKVMGYQNLLMTFLDRQANTFGFSTQQLHQYADQAVQNVGQFLLNLFSNFLGQIPDMILVSLITFIAIYFFLIEEEKIRKIFDRYFYFTPENGNRFVMVLKSSCREVFFSNVLTGIIQSVIVTVGAMVCGIGDGFIVFFITFICSFVPVLGAGPVAFVLSLLSFAQGSMGAGIGMLVISIVSGLADNIIRPYLASMGEVEVDGFVSFLAVIGGVIVLGLPGLFVGPLLASLMYGAIPIILEEYFPKKISQELTDESESSLT